MPAKLTIFDKANALQKMITLQEIKPHATIADYKSVTGLGQRALYNLAAEAKFILGHSHDRKNIGILRVRMIGGKPQVNVTAGYLNEAGIKSGEVNVVVKGGRIILEAASG